MADRLDNPLERRRWFSRRKGAGRGDGFGRFAEATARFMGSPKFVLYMTVFVVLWIAANLMLYRISEEAAWDPYPFILLNLAFSTQASYSAPLIMLAQNRQDDRDRVQAQQDRQRAERNLADTEYLTREIAGLRLALQDVATRARPPGAARTSCLPHTGPVITWARARPPGPPLGRRPPGSVKSSP